MKVEDKKVVAVSYELRLDSKEGEVMDAANEEQALHFIYGTGFMLPKFEENLTNLSAGDSFDFMLTSENGYGAYNEENVADVPLDIFMQDGKTPEGLLTIGNVIPLQDNKGNHFNGKVEKVSDSAVTLDFNHPLAGKDLFFTGKVVTVREATEEELSHGHVHQPGHVHKEGCDGDCGNH